MTNSSLKSYGEVNCVGLPYRVYTIKKFTQTPTDFGYYHILASRLFVNANLNPFNHNLIEDCPSSCCFITILMHQNHFEDGD